MPKKILKQLALTLIENNLKKYFNVSWNHATNEQIFKALSAVTMDELFEIRSKSKRPQNAKGGAKKPVKALHYLTIEILLGKTLKNTLFNLGWEKIFTGALKTKGIAGLGNGGLGRLAACFLDSLSTMGYPAYGCGIRYRFGIFEQRIENGYQNARTTGWKTATFGA
jgi:starch phosphorylase